MCVYMYIALFDSSHCCIANNGSDTYILMGKLAYLAIIITGYLHNYTRTTLL